ACAMHIDMKFAWCPPGTFLMGDKQDYENSVRRVVLTQGFYVSIVPVTQAHWQAVMGTNPSQFPGDDRPVEMGSWDDCQDFCQRRRELTGKAIRLPTEAEWEYACRAGTGTEFCNGNDESALRQVGWFQSNSEQQTHPVGKLTGNAWGLFDMHG